MSDRSETEGAPLLPRKILGFQSLPSAGGKAERLVIAAVKDF